MRPAGCWPAEGAISAATLELLAGSGFRWAASSAAVLRESLALTDADAARDRRALNRPYRLGGTGMNCFFREDTLSDLIGFTYATWHGDDAAANFANEVAQLGRDYEGGNHAVLIALDGENAWEFYPFNGYYFLRALYAQLANHPQLELMTLSQCLERGLQPAPLPRVCAGSWVHGTLATWVGDAAKNRAWDLLCDAKTPTTGRCPASAIRRSGPPPGGSWRCAKARTGSGGSATTTRQKRSRSSTGCSGGSCWRFTAD